MLGIADSSDFFGKASRDQKPFIAIQQKQNVYAVQKLIDYYYRVSNKYGERKTRCPKQRLSTKLRW